MYVAAGPRTAGLDETQVALRGPGVERQAQLADAAPAPPATQQRPELSGGFPDLRDVQRGGHDYPSRNCRGRMRSRWCRDDTSSNGRSEEHTSELQSLMRISYAVFCLKKKKNKQTDITH